MEFSADERAIIWLSACSGLEFMSCHRLLEFIQPAQPEKLMRADKNFFSSVLKRPDAGLYIKSQNEREADLNAFLKEMERREYTLVTRVSELYPEPLKHIPLPPPVLYLSGNVSLVKRKMFTIVGSRIIPPWAEKVGKDIAEELSARFTIVTGLAEGGDSAAIAGAIESGNLISVLPCGLNECYPASHASLKRRVQKAGLLMSECLPDAKVGKGAFQSRNRILAGLSEGVLILSAAKRSGTLMTASYALDAGRDVFALPHNVGAAQGEGCNELLKKGAYVVTSSEDIFSVYGIKIEKRERAALSDEENRILNVLHEYGELHTAELAEKAGMKIYEVSAILAALEIKNYAVRVGGNRYTAI